LLPLYNTDNNLCYKVRHQLHDGGKVIDKKSVVEVEIHFYSDSLPKTRYSGHLLAHLSRNMTQYNQTNQLSLYMEES